MSNINDFKDWLNRGKRARAKKASKKKTPLKKSRLNPISKKRRKDGKIYSNRRKAFLRSNPYCVVCGDRKATEVHHMVGRVGTRYTDVRYFLAVSEGAHKQIHADPKWAEEHGYRIILTNEQEQERKQTYHAWHQVYDREHGIIK